LKRLLIFGLIIAMLGLLNTGCSGDGTVTAGVYTGSMIVKKTPVIDLMKKALDDPGSFRELTEEEGSACEGMDLNDEQIREQIQEALDKGKEIIGVKIPLTITVKDKEGELSAFVKANIAAAFPDEECEEAHDEEFELEYGPGTIKLINISEQQEGVKSITVYEGRILKDGTLEGTFKMMIDSEEYKEYADSDEVMSGTWKAVP